MILINFKHFSFDLINSNQITCKLSVYLNYLFGFTSAWLVVLFSLERLVAVYWPMKLNTICTTIRRKLSIVIVMSSGLIIYSFSLFSTGLQNQYSSVECVPLDSWIIFVKYTTLIDIIASMALPFTFILAINIMIIVKLINTRNIKHEPVQHSKCEQFFIFMDCWLLFSLRSLLSL